MPTSDNQGKFVAQALIKEADPFQVWDVGPGEGTYSDLCIHDTSCSWTAIEVWEPYVEQYGLNHKYNSVVVQDIRKVDFSFSRIGSNALIIFGDVLEHMPEDDARTLILEAKKYFRWILVSIPIVHAPQGEVNGNPYEEHVKHWGFDEMHAAMGYCMAFKGHTIGLYWWDSEEDV
jgi:hypothetical protein